MSLIFVLFYDPTFLFSLPPLFIEFSITSRLDSVIYWIFLQSLALSRSFIFKSLGVPENFPHYFCLFLLVCRIRCILLASPEQDGWIFRNSAISERKPLVKFSETQEQMEIKLRHFTISLGFISIDVLLKIALLTKTRKQSTPAPKGDRLSQRP